MTGRWEPDADQPVGAQTGLFLIGAWIWIIGLVIIVFMMAHVIRSQHNRIERLESQYQELKR